MTEAVIVACAMLSAFVTLRRNKGLALRPDDDVIAARRHFLRYMFHPLFTVALALALLMVVAALGRWTFLFDATNISFLVVALLLFLILMVVWVGRFIVWRFVEGPGRNEKERAWVRRFGDLLVGVLMPMLAWGGLTFAVGSVHSGEPAMSESTFETSLELFLLGIPDGLGAVDGIAGVALEGAIRVLGTLLVAWLAFISGLLSANGRRIAQVLSQTDAQRK